MYSVSVCIYSISEYIVFFTNLLTVYFLIVFFFNVFSVSYFCVFINKMYCVHEVLQLSLKTPNITLKKTCFTL